jgi:diacylglycerol kinase
MIKHWIRKFRNAFRGIWMGTQGQSSFLVHIPAAVLVPVVAYYLSCSAWQFTVLGLCIAMVLSLELVNSALEYLAKGLCQEENVDVGKALDIASGAVLVSSLAAALIGISIFLYQILHNEIG